MILLMTKVILWNRLKQEFQFKMANLQIFCSTWREMLFLLLIMNKVITVPSIANFEMQLNFPAYLNKKIRELSKNRKCCYSKERVTWKMNTLATQSVDWIDGCKSYFSKTENSFILSKIYRLSNSY
jgi:hypothetical protein